ncbi:sugar phosphate isomerase/epimerase family protein [Maritalea porphyrae]|uniref:sugar phosphate isomerase/epimerase family protein n=1 Tax=Maritalea porphyrae TaxID=880732 RepID=UPI0022B0430B|nr:sugar phosphate isomerase/epimerase [Maritalea porphyrae]MCZ4271561.1 sugar phosphate isomerase/epimerase [Maritalea porphyrae]
MDLSYQLYSARNATPWSKVFSALADQGYTQVEGFGGMFDNVAELAADLDNVGLKMPSTHLALELLEDDFDAALEIINTLAVRQVYAPYLVEEERPTDAAGWQVFAQRLSKVSDKLAGYGVTFGWHNHDFEFVALPDGQIPMAILLDNAQNISWEADIAWVIVGGQDPIEWIKRYGNRITAVHMKDKAPDGENLDQDGWTDVGSGTIDWAVLMSAIKSNTPAKIFVMEHDNPADAIAFGANSIAYAKTL